MGVVLVPVGRIDAEVLERLRGGLLERFGQPVSVGREISEPDHAFDPRRQQYLSTAILEILLKTWDPLSRQTILGIVDHDLYVPGLHFVFGEATRGVAVISIARLRQAFYHLPEDRSLFHRRILTEAVHELGHAHGLGHCRSPHCVMFFSNSLEDTDRKGPEFCGACRKKLFGEE